VDPVEHDRHRRLVAQLRSFLDALASAAPLDGDELETDLDRWTTVLRQHSTPEHDRLYGRTPELPSAGQATTPWYEVDEADPPHRLSGRARFSNFFLGGRGAAHGGTVPLLFDELFGWLANAGGMPAARTAYLHTDYRSVLRVDADLTFVAWTDRLEGRKRFLRAELRDGPTLCAEAESLFLTLRPGQP
jgi:acyl-coenzyme A thioesterase PaaI-like protein